MIRRDFRLMAAMLVMTTAGLSGCATVSRPRVVEAPTPASLSTLKSYPNNGFSVISTDDLGRKIYLIPKTDTIWAYGFLMPSGRYAIYNARDIQSLVSLNTGSAGWYDGYNSGHVWGPMGGTARITLRDGRTFVTPLSSLRLFQCANTHNCGAPRLDSAGYIAFEAAYADALGNPSRSANGVIYTSFPSSSMYPSPGLNNSGNNTRSVRILPNIATVQNRFKQFRAARHHARQDWLAARRTAQNAFQRRLEADTRQMRRHVKVGTITNCGPVFDVRLPMVGVQTADGMQFIALNSLYSPDVGCSFDNGVYAGPIYPSRW